MVATTKSTSVAAYAAPTGARAHRQWRRPSGMNSASDKAAMVERKAAICQDVREMALMAAPPVENRNAAAINSSQFVKRD